MIGRMKKGAAQGGALVPAEELLRTSVRSIPRSSSTSKIGISSIAPSAEVPKLQRTVTSVVPKRAPSSV